MNNVPKNIKDAQRLNVYQASAGEYTFGRSYQYEGAGEAKGAEKGEADEPDLLDRSVVPELKPEFKGKYQEPVGLHKRGVTVSPDEVIALGWRWKPEEFPYMTREEVSKATGGAELPDSDLLNWIHYYMMEKVEQMELKEGESREALYESMDEGALLAIGAALEGWIDAAAEDCYEGYMASQR